jgi:large subunit ribosomal protein L6e
MLKKKPATAEASTGKSTRFYPADDVPKPKPSRKSKHNAPKVRASITPGSVLILLAGRFRGKRVVCLKVLASGLLLVSGPFKVNGVPLRRVNPAYVIATSTSVDVSSIDVSSLDDKYFSTRTEAEDEGEEEFFSGDAPKAAVVSDQRKADQKKVDAALLKVVDGTPMLKAYLNAKFSLQKHDRPHNMVF